MLGVEIWTCLPWVQHQTKKWTENMKPSICIEVVSFKFDDNRAFITTLNGLHPQS